MILPLLPLLRLLVLLAFVLPVPAAGRALEREGTVAVMPALRWTQQNQRGGFSPGFMLSFGFKTTDAFEVGIDVGGLLVQSTAEAGDYTLTTIPLGLSLEWTPRPASDTRPIFAAIVGKEFIAVNGPDGHYAEHTPFLLIATAGIASDLSKSMGFSADVGYQLARAKDPVVGKVDGGGFLARAGIYFRWDPLPKPY